MSTLQSIHHDSTGHGLRARYVEEQAAEDGVVELNVDGEAGAETLELHDSSPTPSASGFDRLRVAIDDTVLLAALVHRALDIGWATPGMVTTLEDLAGAGRRAYVHALDVSPSDTLLLARAESTLEELSAAIARARAAVGGSPALESR